MADEPVIPVRVRTARKQHRCDEYLCRVPIEPGDKYEDHRQPPGSYDWGDYSHWVNHKVHAPRIAEHGPTGCELAAAYQEDAARERERNAASELRRQMSTPEADSYWYGDDPVWQEG